MDRTIYITEDIIPTSGDQGTKENSLVGKIMSQTYALAAEGTEPIHVFIDTDGGSLKVALTIYDMLKSTKCPIHTYGLSEVCSAGVVIYLAGEKRFAFKHTQFMTHPASLSASGNHLDFDRSVDVIRAQGLAGRNIFKDVLKVNDELFDKLHDLTTYKFADEAKELGLVTDIIDSYPEELLEGYRKVLTKQGDE
tara:strand:- start:106 stop:687 length:582 start_codon:yes stop_codon:yes gene_type:complete